MLFASDFRVVVVVSKVASKLKTLLLLFHVVLSTHFRVIAPISHWMLRNISPCTGDWWYIMDSCLNYLQF